MKAIAIDGPSGAGKSTIARRAAAALGYIYVDTGALYRSIGWYMATHGVADTKDAATVAARLEEVSVELGFVEGEQRVFVNGEDVSQAIRTPDMAMHASNVSAIPAVREFLFRMQRDIAEKNNIVMDGRDIGTVVLPNADVKLFLTASPEDRARRRYEEHLSRGQQVSYEDILEDVKKRDDQDMNRAIAPLKQADDAVLLDTTGNELEASVRLVLDTIGTSLQKKAVPVKPLGFYKFGRALVKAFTLPFYRLHAEFEEELPQGRGFILACNHVSNMDPIALGICCPRQVRYMAKSELFKVPVLGFLIRHLGAFPVARGKGDTGALDSAALLVEGGGVLGIFPEGGRSKDGKFHKVKSGTAVVASKTGADIVPAGIIYGKRKWFHRCPVTVKFGRVIRNEELSVSGHNKAELRAANALLGGRIAALLGEECQ